MPLDIQELESNCFRLEGQVTSLEEEVDELQYEIDDLQVKNKRTQDELTNMTDSLQYTLREINKYKDHCSELETTNLRLEFKIETLESNTLHLRNHCDFLKVENDHLRTQIELLQKRLPDFDPSSVRWINEEFNDF
jgi:chromosome segregation ATPase